MIGWWIVISTQSPEERDRADQEAPAGGGYPNRYTARAGDVLPLIHGGGIQPPKDGVWIFGIDDGEEYAQPPGWMGKIEVHADRVAAWPRGRLSCRAGLDHRRLGSALNAFGDSHVMSRSRRKTPIVGHTTCRSEREDKKLWHQRWRTRERTALASASPDALSAHLPLLENQVSNIWSMGKDGRSYWPVKRQAATADRIANHRGRNPQERASLKKRLLRKWMSK